jgi:hypothetical protein
VVVGIVSTTPSSTRLATHSLPSLSPFLITKRLKAETDSCLVRVPYQYRRHATQNMGVKGTISLGSERWTVPDHKMRKEEDGRLFTE